MLKTPSRHAVALGLSGLAVIAGAPAGAQQGTIVPLVSLQHSDNAFGRTTAERIYQDGVVVTTPPELRAVSDTILGLGAMWLNAVESDLGGVRLTMTPFVRYRSLQDSGAYSWVYGASLAFRLHGGTDDRTDLRVTASRLDASWAIGPIDSVLARLRHRRELAAEAHLLLGLTASWQSLAGGGSVSRLGLEAEYGWRVGQFDLAASGHVATRSSGIDGQAGSDAGLGFDLEYALGPGQAFAALGADWARDTEARQGQPLAREETTGFAEIGYAWPLDASGLARVVLSARHEVADANLALYESTTNSLGVTWRVGF